MNVNETGDSLASLYDQLADTYAAGRHRFDTTPILERLAQRLPTGAWLLDVGCGAGEPTACYFLNQGCAVVGIDLSERMLTLARQRAPEADFRRMDMRQLDFPAESFDAITAVYSVFHLPRADHQALFAGFARVLQPGGVLLLTLATREYSGHDEFDGEVEFLGRRLPYSHDRPEAALNKLRAAGFAILDDRLLAIGGETFYWVIAGKSGV